MITTRTNYVIAAYGASTNMSPEINRAALEDRNGTLDSI